MTVGVYLIADNVAALSVGKAGWFYKSHLYIGSIPIIGGSIPLVLILILLLGLFLEPIAQLVEHRTFNPGVFAGSNPARFIIDLGESLHHYLSDDT